jgi:origin recognition complex subunit 1
VYYNLSSSALATPSIILRHCSVSSSREDAYNIVYQDDEVDEEAFVCFYATNPARGLYYEFDWAALRTQAIPADSSSTDAWTLVADDLVDVDQKGKKRAAKKKGAKKGIAKGIRQQGDGEPPSKRRRVMKDADTQDRGDAPMDVDESSDDCPPEEAYDPNQPSDASSDEPMDTQVSDDEGVSDSDSDEDDHDREPRTPSKRGKQARPRTPRRRKNQAPTTPSRKGRQLAAPTPHSKAALRARKRSIAVRPPPPQLSQEHYRALSK